MNNKNHETDESVQRKEGMTTEQALQVLQYHNRWRRGEDIEMTNPKKLGEAIDKAIEVLALIALTSSKQ